MTSLTWKNRFPYKAVFVDLDGTLLNSQGQIADYSRVVLNTLTEAGVAVCIATGRPMESIRRVVSGLTTRAPVISLNGSQVYGSLEGPLWETFYLDAKLGVELQTFLMRHSSAENFVLDSDEGWYALNRSHEIDELSQQYNTPPKPIDRDNPVSSGVISCLVYAPTREARNSIELDLREHFGERCNICHFSGWPWIEVSPLRVNKGGAMAWVCDRLGVTLEDALAFGDGTNDIEMIERAGLGVAMHNADAAVKAVAGDVTATNDHHGVAAYIEKILRTV